MKTKFIQTFLVAVAILFSAVFIDSSAYAADDPPKKMDKAKQVELYGSLIHGTIRSAFTPFIVMQSDDLLTVYCLQNLTDIDLVILDESGQVVYSDIIDPISGGSFTIDIANWAEGYYTLSFSDGSGNSVYGAFEI